MDDVVDAGFLHGVVDAATAVGSKRLQSLMCLERGFEKSLVL